MDKTSITRAVRTIQKTAHKHQPEILTGMGIAGGITAAIMAVKATPKALDLLAEIKAEHEEDTDKKAYSKAVLVKVGPVYIPSILVGAYFVPVEGTELKYTVFFVISLDEILMFMPVRTGYIISSSNCE